MSSEFLISLFLSVIGYWIKLRRRLIVTSLNINSSFGVRYSNDIWPHNNTRDELSNQVILNFIRKPNLLNNCVDGELSIQRPHYVDRNAISWYMFCQWLEAWTFFSFYFHGDQILWWHELNLSDFSGALHISCAYIQNLDIFWEPSYSLGRYSKKVKYII